ncbi:ABC transporter permease [Sporosarcina sp. Marseille-Q4063]|uniref:ABC transporter permease n=1 Tax=Sporosarcina sp. Marseille-Q4063 TaxID=2810514 RepID=UPI001BB0D38B|nr:ABC transporter permease [Sporosarcina sp. Marseille-Q4063]QUW20553.1 ABC transporter permease [Sporosarcina sp. Marseille-Q4063]
MLKLIQNEWMKLWHKKATWIMAILLVVAIIGLAGLTKLSERFTDTTWIEEMEAEVVQMEEQLASPDLTDDERADLEAQKQGLEENIMMNAEWNQPGSRERTIVDAYGTMSLVTLFTIIASAGIVASEFSQGTIKMLLSRPVKRWKILTSKYVTIILFGLSLTVLVYVFTIISAFIFFPSAEGNSIIWSGTDLALTAIWGKSAYMMFLSLVNVIVISTFAFMVGSVFRSTSLAVGLSIFLFFSGTIIVMFLEKFEIAKYIFFAHDLTQYELGFKMLDSNTMAFSVAVVLVYAVVFLAVSYFTFSKRDVTA